MTQEVLKQWADDISKAYDILAWGHSERAAEILKNTKVSIYKALAQTEKEPVALPCCGYTDASAVKWNPFNNVVQCHNCGQVYTSQPQRKPLTHKEIWNAIRPLTQSDAVCMSLVQISMDEYRAIEAAHGIKENT